MMVKRRISLIIWIMMIVIVKKRRSSMAPFIFQIYLKNISMLSKKE